MFNKLIVIACALLAAQTAVAAPPLAREPPVEVCAIAALPETVTVLLTSLGVAVITCSSDEICESFPGGLFGIGVSTDLSRETTVTNNIKRHV